MGSSDKSNVPPFYNDFIRHGRVSQLNPFLSGKWGKGRLRSFNEIAIPGEVELRVADLFNMSRKKNKWLGDNVRNWRAKRTKCKKTGSSNAGLLEQ
ncbi:hypothetical protein OUZ56_004702 [Daphnia magna]|uniref:Uncharacterized protein n=1 Tax=Daphnia magna TaxID=35525 RepID=A0ABQ9YQK7_9CRUS|nr:hypothetical protein OUZ56_004702 [Daphnia magna]